MIVDDRSTKISRDCLSHDFSDWYVSDSYDWMAWPYESSETGMCDWCVENDADVVAVLVVVMMVQSRNGRYNDPK